MANPRAFISYSWDDERHKRWVADLAARLRSDGIDTALDQWDLVPGDQLAEYMEKEIRENDYVLIICTANYRTKSDHRKGGVGYEGGIMTAEVLTMGNHRKFIPVLATGSWKDSAPSWLKGKVYVDLSADKALEENYSELVATLHGAKPSAPPLRTPLHNLPSTSEARDEPNEPIRIVDVIVDEVTQPRQDGTHRSALYAVPFRLNRIPSEVWSELFVGCWNKPPQYGNMHRPGIASVRGDQIVLDGTTIDEVKAYHRKTLVQCVDLANKREIEYHQRRRNKEERRRQQVEAHRIAIQDGVQDLSFDC